ncbi:MAG: hypothetical protein MHM6MM_005745 [Cercozoa sp. M6MM]
MIARKRAENGIVEQEEGKTYKKFCPVCDKPNTLTVDKCTACAFELVDEDIKEAPSNVFLDIIAGRMTNVEILYRDEEILLFDDAFPVSDNHFQAIPIEVIDDINTLTREHIPLLKRLYEAGKAEIKRRNLAQITDIDEQVVIGFNYPVSVKHLHMHFCAPPFYRTPLFEFPRWHTLAHVMRDLEEHGEVSLNDPDNEQCAAAGHEHDSLVLKLHDDAKAAVKRLGLDVRADD